MSRAVEHFRAQLVTRIGKEPAWAEMEADSLIRFLVTVARAGKTQNVSTATYYRRTKELRRVGVAPVTDAAALVDLARVARARDEASLLNIVWVLNADQSRRATDVRKRWGELVDDAQALMASPA